ncbi:unnamed protein product [Chironomus riparius]|uniref:Uncharacterized protein n=1 Tax=Chironomus riparius TaxID=315576 RepID=A0A9N9WYB3_9DIPT|nr:unnamed protein product [Chironomus riparius]
MSTTEVIVKQNNCFVCGTDLKPNSRSIMDSTNFSQKPIYKFIESFVGLKLDLPPTTKAALCDECLNQLQEYEKICRRAAKIQELISENFKQTQKSFKETEVFTACGKCFTRFDSNEDIDNHECIIDENEVDEVVSYIEYIGDDEDEEDDGKFSEENEQREKRKRTEILSYTCSTCNKAFEKKRDYSQHIKLAHLPDGAKVFACEICDDINDNIFPTELELKFHNVIKHPTDKNSALQCPGCPKTFSNKSLLTRHFGLHLQDKPLVCELCGKRYFHSSSFHMHMVAHKGVKQHTCKECGRSFLSTSHLNRHLKTHSGVKNYECHECGSRFAQRYNLKAHMNIHYGISRKRKSKGPGDMQYEQINE